MWIKDERGNWVNLAAAAKITQLPDSKPDYSKPDWSRKPYLAIMSDGSEGARFRADERRLA